MIELAVTVGTRLEERQLEKVTRIPRQIACTRTTLSNRDAET
jgi:hypothetical protein